MYNNTFRLIRLYEYWPIDQNAIFKTAKNNHLVFQQLNQIIDTGEFSSAMI